MGIFLVGMTSSLILMHLDNTDKNWKKSPPCTNMIIAFSPSQSHLNILFLRLIKSETTNRVPAHHFQKLIRG